MSWEPTVSIIIPFHNQENVVEKTLGAVLSLDYPTEKLQIIVINDGSTDKTESILQNMTGKKRLILINHKENKGRSLATAPAFVTAMETGKIALAPKLSLFSVPSNLSIILSIVS